MSEDTASADPWRDLPVEDPGVRVIVTKRRLPAEREQVQPGMQHHAQECTGEWREFGQQPGTHLRLVRAGVVRRELRTAEQQAVASLGIAGMLPGAASVGGKTFTWKAVPESPGRNAVPFPLAGPRPGPALQRPDRRRAGYRCGPVRPAPRRRLR